jgi:hypothetical protein
MRGLFFGGTLVGILLGLGLGLVIAWYLWPVSATEADPADLRLDLKDDYLRMIAASYSLDGDMAHALQRLDTLRLPQRDVSIGELIQGEPRPLYQQALIRLALDLKRQSVALARPTFTPRPTKTRFPGRALPTAPPRAVSTPVQTVAGLPPSTTASEPTPLPATSVPNPNAPLFLLKSKSTLTCLDTRGHGVIQVFVQDADGKPLPGIGVEVNWSAGDDILYTGLKPERGMGYADEEVGPGRYNLRLTDNAQSNVVESLGVDEEPSVCSADALQVRGWMLVFQQGK